jgi:steroid delta-isomerase-like uncharacterized protein
MTVTTNPAVQLYERLQAHDVDKIDELLTPDFHGHGMGGDGPDSLVGALRFWLTAFPDTTIDIHDVITADDKVVVRATMRGTHQAKFLGVEPTGKPFEIGSTDVHRLVDGRIAESWGLCDLATMLIQVGAFTVS